MKYGLIIALAAVVFVSGCVSTPTYSLLLENLDEKSPLSPGVYVLHDSTFNLNYEGEIVPAEFHKLAEVGEQQEFSDYLLKQEGVVVVQDLSEPILPGESVTLEIDKSSDGLYLSAVQMIVQSNDGYVLIDSVKISENLNVQLVAKNFDAGTEKNADTLGCGFECGQPDPSRGEENLDNGESETENVKLHPQATGEYLRITIS